MIVGLLRIFYVLLPISIVTWALMDNASFTRAIEYGNTLQGRGGVLIINADGRETRGAQIGKFLEKSVPLKNENWRITCRSLGSQTDAAIRYIENYWFWGCIGIVLLAGVFFLLTRGNYK